MAKDAYYFSHDSNARHDPKILAMRADYDITGYGIFWTIIEMLRESEDYRMPYKKYIFKAIAMQVQSDAYTSDKIHKFIDDCISEYELFDTDQEYFWSYSLLKRMDKKEELRQKRKEAAEKRWNKKPETQKNEQNNAPSMQNNANALQNDTKERKGKEIERKGKESKVNKTSSIDDVAHAPMVDEGFAKVCQFYESNIGPLIPHIGEVLKDLTEIHKPELVEHAFRKSAEANAGNKLKYAEAILNGWKNQKLETIEAITTHETNRNHSKKRSENAPDWLDADKPSKPTQQDTMSAEEIEIERQKLLQELQAK